MSSLRLALIALACAAACSTSSPNGARAQGDPTSQPTTPTSGQPLAPPPAEGQRTAIFAGGCFWCMEGPFEHLEGVSEVLSGFTGGPEEHPTYDQVAHGLTGHTEAVIVYYDPTRVSYEVLLRTFWRSMDPTDAGGQFADRGSQYRPAIFVANEEERAAAEASKAALEASGVFDEPIVVPVVDAAPFWVAEDYHQNYYRTNPEHYQRYRRGSGREAFLDRHWAGIGHDYGHQHE
jgi:peptide methionine sulfoxide reductase msrA/msrB